MSDRGERTSRIADPATRLWELWRRGQRPDLAVFLAGMGALPLSQLVAVLRMDQQMRFNAGEHVRAEQYLANHPHVAGDPERALEIIYGEFLLREGAKGGPGASVEEFLARFPTYAARLRQQFDLHKALGPDDSTSTDFIAPEYPPTAISPPILTPRANQPTIPGYQIVNELGRGGMGIVYHAVDQRRGRAVALKVMQGVDPALLYRFKQEFRGLAGLSHPNLVTLYELTGDDGQWYFTMELLEGVTFLAHLRGDRPAREPIDSKGMPRLREVMAQLADGLLALHHAGKLHRDIKPGNVMVTTQGRVVLLDFGLAADLDSMGQHLSIQPRLLGTAAYMAPEQAACQPVTPASDWYAVGVMLYEALTGHPPFEGPPLAVLTDKQQRDPPERPELAQAPADLVAVCRQLLSRDPAARPRGEEVRRLLREGRPASPASLPSAEVPLVGRQKHLEALADAYAAMRAGRTVIVEVHGRSGMGKSALVRHFLDTLEKQGDAVVLAGRCYEQESVPYKALDNLIDELSRYLEGLTDAKARAVLPRDTAALTRAFPVLRRVEAVADSPRRSREVSEPQEVRRRALAALRELLGRISDRRPLVLLIDDLQWGDLDSAALLADLLAPPDPPTLLLVAAYRSEDAETSPCLRAFRRMLQAGELEIREVVVDPLDFDERRELARVLLGKSDPTADVLAEAIGRQSAGYPFFVHELVQSLRGGQRLADDSPGDITLHGVLRDRVQRLPEEARRLLEVVAVADRPLAPRDACQAADLKGDDRRALAMLRAGRLVRGSKGEAIEAYHDRIRETVVDHLPPETLVQTHRRLAEVLEAGGTADSERLAVHWQGAGETVRAAEHYIRAADQAAEALALERAAVLYRRALELGRPAGETGRALRVRLGDALAGAGRGAEAAGEYLACAEQAQPGEALELRRRAALQLLSSGHVDAGLSTLEQVLAAVGMKRPRTPRAAYWSLVGQRFWLRLRGLRFRKRPAAAIPAAELTALDVCAAAATGLSMVDTIQGAYFQTRALLLALRAGEPSRLAAALALEASHESIDGTRKGRRTDRLLEAAGALANELDRPYPRAMILLARGLTASLEGDWRAGLRLCDEAEGIFRESCTGVMWELGTSHRFALWPLMYLGEVAEINRRLPAWIKEALERDDLYGVSNLSLVVRTFVSLAADEPARAREDLRQLMDRWSQQGYHVQHMNRLYDETQIDLYEGNGAAAWERLAQQWPILEQSHLLRVQQVRIFMGHLRGRAALASGCPDEAGREAQKLAREGAPWASALGRLLQAGVAAAHGDLAESASLLRDGADRCDGAAMHLFAAAARRRLGTGMDGQDGKDLVSQADAWMTKQTIVNPVRMTSLLVPMAATD
jgi:hypothetical protein